MLIIPYTSIHGEKDRARTDVRVFSDYDKFKSPVYNAKIAKILPHHFMECDISIWMDGNIQLKISPEEAVEKWLGESDMAFFRHYKSKDLEWELKWIKYVWRSKDRSVYEECKRQVEKYAPLNIRKEEMAMGGFIIRRHTLSVARFNEAWWAEICVNGQRDQLSLPVVLRAFPELKVNRIDLDIKNNEFLTYTPHLV